MIKTNNSILLLILFINLVHIIADEAKNKETEAAIIKKHLSPHLFIPKGMKSKFEYQHSFKGPKLVYQKGENNVGIPFFRFGAHTIPEEDFVRLVPSLKGKKGFVYSKKQFNFSEGFVVDIYFRMNGKKLGGDGMGFWYVEEKSEFPGRTMGGPSKWKGLAVLFDTYDNDGGENNPMISAISNDGTKAFDASKDGKDIIEHSCLRNIRNRGLPVHVKLVYAEKQLTVYVSELYEKSVSLSDVCLTVKDLTLAKMGYFGLTAETGDLVDDVDVFRFEVHSLSGTPKNDKTISEGEKKKLDEEFSKFFEEFEKNIKDYQKKHKDDKDFLQKQLIKQGGGEESTDKTLRQIWEYQATIKEMIHQLLEEVNKIKEISGKGGVGNENFEYIRSSLNSINSEISKSSYNVETKFSHMNSKFDDMQILLAKISREVHSLLSSDLSPRETPPSISVQTLIITSLLQVVLIIGFIFYKDQRDSAKRKFY